MKQRPAIPAELKRRVLVEAGHRCAIPACRQTPVELAHITPWAQVRGHTFENLIALCPTCHTRFDKRNGDIDEKSMLIYKSNLSLINSRYGDFERRVLEFFSQNQNKREKWLPGGLEIMLMYLINDGLLIDTGQNKGIFMSGMPSQRLYQLTPKGREFIDRWFGGREIE